MSDDIFRLTPRDVRQKELPMVMRGYDRQRVDDFKLEVAEELERLLRINLDLESQCKANHEQLRSFRERDKALNDALISAQQLRSEIREQAEREAQLILREARAEGDRLLDEQRAEIRRLQEEIAGLERMRRAYLAQLRHLAERQLAEIEAAEAAPREGDDPRANKVTPAWLDTLIKE
jgi:DivIVA domain-containing protein